MTQYEITPVEMYDGIHYKRDDLFCPYGKYCVNGGKVRQAIELLVPQETIIKQQYSGVVTHTQVHSTTGTIIAHVCKTLNIPCVICIGGSNDKSIQNHHMMRLAIELGADVRNVCGHGMHAPVIARMKNIAKDENLFNAVYSHNANTYKQAILDTTTYQVQNIPDKLDQLVVPVGSGIHFAAIIRGLHIYNKTVGTVVGLCVGPERSKNINSWINPLEFPYQKYELHCLDTVYGKACQESFGGGMLDELYESKAHKWMKTNMDTTKQTLFWIVGKRLTQNEIERGYNGICNGR